MSSKYTFTPTTRLRLEVERPPAAGEYVNRIVNPSSVWVNPSAPRGAWGWTTPLDGSALEPVVYGGAPALRYVTVANEVNEFYTAPFPVTPGEQLRGQWEMLDSWSGAYRVRFRWFDISGNQIAPSTSDDITESSTNHRTSIRTVPAGVRFAALSFRPTMPDFTDTIPAAVYVVFRNVEVFSSTMGSLTDTAMAANAGAPTVLWENVLGPTLEVIVRREEFDLGTMSATILDSTLDPAVADTLRPGRRVRLTAMSGAGAFESLFTGTLDAVNVEYDLRTRKASDPKHTKISLSAVDAMQALGAMKRKHGVDNVSELPYMLEDGSLLDALPFPWDCDGWTGHLGGATITSSNDNASAADQVALTRDGALGYAWVDRQGVLVARSTLPATVDYTFDEGVYSDLDLSFDPRRVINSVEMRQLFYDAGTDETTEGGGDIYQDPASVQTWGKRQRTFTLTSTKLATYADFPGAVFAANASPRIQPRSLTVPIHTDPDRAARAFIDLYDLVRVSNVDKGIDEQVRVTSLEHRITTDMWLMVVGFAGDTTVAIPQRQPSR